MNKYRKIHRITTLFYLATLVMSSLFGQESELQAVRVDIQWEEQNLNDPSNFPHYFPFSFEDAEYTGNEVRLPVWHNRIGLDNYANQEVSLINWVEEPSSLDAKDWASSIRTEYDLESFVSQSGFNRYTNLSMVPLRIHKGKVYRLTQFYIEFTPVQNNNIKSRNGEYALISELNDGTFYKFPIQKSGLYRIDRKYLSDQGINPDEINPIDFQVFGNGGGKLPETLETERIDDLKENPLYFSGDNDSNFEEGEYFIFYGEGPDTWSFNESKGTYEFTKNIYDSDNFYYIRTDGNSGLRISSVSNQEEASYNATNFDFPQVHENDKTNLLAQYDHTEGTGQTWYGESFFTTKSQDFSSYFNFEDRIKDETIQAYVKFAARHSSTSILGLEINEQRSTKNINGVSVQSPEATYARNGVIETNLLLSQDIEEVLITTTAYQGWLDKIIINFRKNLTFENEPVYFSDRHSLDHEISSFTISSSNSDFIIWDITNSEEAIQQTHKLSGSNQYQFSYNSDTLRSFVAFIPSAITNSPGDAVPVSNQNLHGIFEADMLIVYHEDFEEEAEELATHRRNHNGFVVQTVNIEHIFNEFSSGRQDPTALRDFAKMIYDRDENFNYLLLFGDGSYDYRSILNEDKNDNFIPVYETTESLNPISGYVSDDYFGLLSDNEGYELNGDLDVSVGRLPVRTKEQAEILVQKIIEYETSPSNNGDWQNRIALIADDEDFSRHVDQSEFVGKYVAEDHPVFNLEKIYLDAFQQEVNPGGHRYPEVNKSINDNIYKGVLAMTYIGHGGPGGFAQERVLKLEDIYNWNNENKLPLLITATCSFAGFDDPSINTAGEASILKENGGVIALFSTVRLVYSNENSKLINSVYNELFKKYDNHYLKLGDILKYAKNNIGNKDNKRKFFLFGDPAMQLALPEYKVYTTSINGIDVQTQAYPDTLNALTKVTVRGYVGDESGNIQTGFNGIVYPTVFDKIQKIETLSNDPNSPKREFDVQKKVLFKGAASVSAGEFAFEFIIPKDIDYRFGQGKISYYYSNGDNLDANGYFTGITIGGSSDESITDEDGPVIDLYMNHTDFQPGDITNNRPILLAYIYDETGINISGNSIGHDLGAILDEDQLQYYRLNDFFESSVDDYTSGKIEFPLASLEPGLHSIYVEAWDVLNNKGEASIEFMVAENEEQLISNVFNFPNPFAETTEFQFEHTLPDTDLDVKIYIYNSMNGRLINVLSANAFTDGHKVDGIKWDARQSNGYELTKGVYFYTIDVYSSVLGISIESDFKKLLIIK